MKVILLLLAVTIYIGTAQVYAQGSDEKVSLRVSEEKSVGGDDFKIKFLSVLEDSRCPEGTNCIWAGNAKVELEIDAGANGMQKFELNSDGDPREIVFAGRTVTIVDLTPRPAENVRIDKNAYVVTLNVARTADPVDPAPNKCLEKP
ncbi:MAG: hypothetical protein KIS76_05000 [Pyrinomonadaceae bacterium]|nr:hypothetical protein [Pyrinomonadaceae bacterium]